ncbi:MAG: DUF177 domain-containing protein [Chloroflexi bacterium]|nr:DUF177 domain-containing protein [Chloroflexota bacterium]
MYFNVSQLLKEPAGARRTVEIDDPLLLFEGRPVSQVSGTANLLRTPDGIWVRAVLQTTILSECSRCLNEGDQPVRIEIEEEYLPTADIVTGAVFRLSEEESESFYIDSHHTLDLRDAIRQYAVMSVPMKPICRADCAGICPTCGANRNEMACECGEAASDNRWGPLLDLSAAGKSGP